MSARAASLLGRTAVVTGGGRGTGRGIALELARMGAALVVVGRREELLLETCAAAEELGARASALAADVCAPDFLAALERAAPRVDVLVNNATSFARYGALESVPEDELQRLLASALVAPLRLVAHCLPGMKARGFGRIVNIGSVGAQLGAFGQAAYASAKSGLVGLTRSVAVEAGRSGVTCNLLELGLIATERVAETVSSEVREALVRATPVGRIGTVEDVAHAVAFLVSPEAGFVNGACLPVSGGLELGLVARRLAGKAEA